MTGNRLWAIGVTVLILAVAVLGWIVVISPTLTQAESAHSQVQSIDAQNAAQRASIASLKTQYEKLPALQSDLEKLQAAIPASADLDDFLDQLQDLAASSGVVITSFLASEATSYGTGADGVAAVTPAPATDTSASGTATPTPTPTPTDSTTTTTTTDPAQPATDLAGKLFTVPITVALKGSPEQIMAFTNAGQTDARFFLVTSVSFTGTGPSATGTLVGSVFVVRESSAVTAQ